MDTVFKVCDVMENVSLSMATVVPRCFVCGMDEVDRDVGREDREYIPACGDLTTKYASSHLNYIVDDNSVCATIGDNERTDESAPVIPIRTDQEKRKRVMNAPRHPKERKNVDDHMLLRPDNKNFGKESSWASIDGRQPRYMEPKSNYSKSVMGFHDEPTTDDDGTFDETYCDESRRSLADRIGVDEGCSDFDPMYLTVSLDKLGLGFFGLPLQWTRVVTKQSSWGTNDSNMTSSTCSMASTSSSGNTHSSTRNLKNSRDDYNSLGQKDSMNDSSEGSYQEIMKKNKIGTAISKKEFEVGFGSTSKENSMMRELPSFGKSREFRSFQSNRSNRSLEEQPFLYSLKPTYMTADESKQLHEESSRYKYILHSASLDPSLAASSAQSESRVPQDQEVVNDYFEYPTNTTTIPYSSLSKSSPKQFTPMGSSVSTSSSKRKSFEKFFRNDRSPFSKLH